MEDRRTRKLRDWEELRRRSPAERLEMAFQLTAFVRELAEGAERARAEA